MNIIINGKKEFFESVATLMDLVVKRELNLERIVVEYNLDIVPKDKWSEINLKDKDTIEIVSFVGGG